jgi:hypothetical protein
MHIPNEGQLSTRVSKQVQRQLGARAARQEVSPFETAAPSTAKKFVTLTSCSVASEPWYSQMPDPQVHQCDARGLHFLQLPLRLLLQ